jgi:hypothetical protein
MISNASLPSMMSNATRWMSSPHTMGLVRVAAYLSEGSGLAWFLDHDAVPLSLLVICDVSPGR